MVKNIFLSLTALGTFGFGASDVAAQCGCPSVGAGSAAGMGEQSYSAGVSSEGIGGPTAVQDQNNRRYSYTPSPVPPQALMPVPSATTTTVASAPIASLYGPASPMRNYRPLDSHSNVANSPAKRFLRYPKGDTRRYTP